LELHVVNASSRVPRKQINNIERAARGTEHLRHGRARILALAMPFVARQLTAAGRRR